MDLTNRKPFLFLFFILLFSINYISTTTGAEDPIDTFDVHPGNTTGGRWNVTHDNLNSTIEGENLRIHKVNNDSTTKNQFAMNRQTTELDDEILIEQKIKHDNRSEYYRDVLGDAVDFTEDDDKIDWGAEDYEVATNGILEVSPSGSSTYMYMKPMPASTYFYIPLQSELLTTSEFDIKVTGITNWYLVYYCSFIQDDFWRSYRTDYWSPSTGQAESVSYSNSTGWHHVSIDLQDIITEYASTPETATIWSIRVTLDMSSSDKLPDDATIYFDNFEIFMNLDYATHLEGEIEDSWDFVSSKEYTYHNVEDIADFNDGTKEIWTLNTGLSDAVTSNGWYNIMTGNPGSGQDSIEFRSSGESIDSSVYTYFTMEYYFIGSNMPLSAIIEDGSGNQLWSDPSPSYSNNTKYLMNVDLSADPDWTGTETGLRILFTTCANINFYANFTFINEVSRGDVEGFGNWHGLKYTNPKGHITQSFWDTSKTYDYFLTPTSLNLDYNVFETVTWRVKWIDDSGLSGKIQPFAYVQDGGLLLTGTTETIQHDTWTTFSYNIYNKWKGDSDWDDTNILRLGFYIYDGDGSSYFEGGEQFQVDYVLSIGSWQDQEVTIGYIGYDNNKEINISIHALSGTNTSRIEIEFYDVAGHIAYYYYSNYYELYNEIIIYDIQFDIIRSEFTFKCEFKNGTELFDIDYPQDYYADSGRSPIFFKDAITPSIFVHCEANFTWINWYINYIDADFAEISWKQTDTPTDSGFTGDSWRSAQGEGSIDDISKWRLHIPRFDSMSGKVTLATNSSLGADEELVFRMYFYNVHKENGSVEQIFGVYFYYTNAKIYLSVWNNSEILYLFEYNKNTELSPTMLTYNVYGDTNRRAINFECQIYVNENDTNPVGGYSTRQTPNFDWTSEFALEFEYEIDINANTLGRVSNQEWSYISKDIFVDIIVGIQKGIENIIVGIFSFIFIPLFTWLGEIFNAVAGGAVVAINAVLNSISTAVNQVASGIWALIGPTLTDLWNTIETIVTDLWGHLQTALPNIVNWVFSALNGIINTTITWLADIFFALYDGLFALFGLQPIDFIALLVGNIETVIWFFTNLLPAIGDFVSYLNAWFNFLWVILFLYIIAFPLFEKNGLTEAIGEILNRHMIDITGGLSIIGIRIPIPLGLVAWGLFSMAFGVQLFWV